MPSDDKYIFLALPVLPARLSALETGWYLGFQPHEISILANAGMLEPLGDPPANSAKFFAAASLAALRDNPKWLEKASTAIRTYWRRKNGQKRMHQQSSARPAVASADLKVHLSHKRAGHAVAETDQMNPPVAANPADGK